MSGRMYTRANNQENLVISRIDRVFCSTEFGAKYPMASARALPRIGNDRTPIVWDSGIGQTNRCRSFKFEKWWITRPDFKEVVKKPGLVGVIVQIN